MRRAVSRISYKQNTRGAQATELSAIDMVSIELLGIDIVSIELSGIDIMNIVLSKVLNRFRNYLVSFA